MGVPVDTRVCAVSARACAHVCLLNSVAPNSPPPSAPSVTHSPLHRQFCPRRPQDHERLCKTLGNIQISDFPCALPWMWDLVLALCGPSFGR